MSAGRWPSLLRSTAAALRAQADALEAAAGAEQSDPDPWLDLASAATQYPVAAETLRTWVHNGWLRACCAERGRIVFRRSWLEVAFESRPYRLRTRGVADAANDGTDAADPDALDLELTSGRLVATRKGAP